MNIEMKVFLQGINVNSVREEGDIGMFITLFPKVLYKRFLIRWINNFVDLLNFDLYFNKFNVQTFQQLILIYRRGNFAYHLWGCTLIFRSLQCSVPR